MWLHSFLYFSRANQYNYSLFFITSQEYQEYITQLFFFFVARHDYAFTFSYIFFTCFVFFRTGIFHIIRSQRCRRVRSASWHFCSSCKNLSILQLILLLLNISVNFCCGSKLPEIPDRLNVLFFVLQPENPLCDLV